MSDDRLNRRLNRVKNLVGAKSPTSAPSNAPQRYQRLAEYLGGRLVDDPAGCFCLVTTKYPIGYRFGERTVAAHNDTAAVQISSFEAEERAGEARLDELLFFDTETTGLGGAGAVAFLVGCGSITPRGFEVRQYVLPDYGDEAAMLEHVLTEFAPERSPVSYNGRAFDMNLLRDRMIVNRVARQIPQAEHFDLLHSARRLYRRRLADCTLTNIEREIFGFHREGDIPGYLIPSVYFDWLQADNLEAMEPVLEHNRLDILALYFLLLQIDKIFRDEGASLDSIDDVYSLSRVYGRRKQNDKVAANYRSLAGISDRPPAPEVLLFHAMALKRIGDWPGAVEIWEELSAGNRPEAFAASLELAKYFEHRVKNLDQAFRYAQLALRQGGRDRRHQAALDHRLARLRRKMKS